MAAYGNRKNLIVYILKILQDHSDANHPIFQKDIMSKLEKEYYVSCNRKTISTNIDALTECGYDIVRSKKGIYIQSSFSNEELHLLIDQVMLAPYITKSLAKDLVAKITALGSDNFAKTVWNKTLLTTLNRTSATPELLPYIEMVHTALATEKAVELSMEKRVMHNMVIANEITFTKPLGIFPYGKKCYYVAMKYKSKTPTFFDLAKIKSMHLMDCEERFFNKPQKSFGEYVNDFVQKGTNTGDKFITLPKIIKELITDSSYRITPTQNSYNPAKKATI